MQNFAPKALWLKLGLILLAGFVAVAGNAQSFDNPLVISGFWGSTNFDNTGTSNTGPTSIAGVAPQAPIWFQWVAPQDGVVTMDTIGSLDDGTFQPLDTVMAVFTGSSLSSLSQVAANDNLFPINNGNNNFTTSQSASTAQEILSQSADYYGLVNAGPGFAGPGTILTYGHLPAFLGPSGLRFNAKGGQTYYFVVDSKPASIAANSSPIFSLGTGEIQLSWAYQPAGVFRFASEDEDPLGSMLLYQTSGTESQPLTGTDNSAGSAVLTYYNYNAQGVLVTVTRVGGSVGRQTVIYQTIDGASPVTITNQFGTNVVMVPNLPIGTNDVPAFGEYTTNIVYSTNVTYSCGETNYTYTTNSWILAPDYTPVTNTLVFDDYEMSKTILIPISANLTNANIPFQNRQKPGSSSLAAQVQANRVFGIQLSNPMPDPNESGGVSAPRVDPYFSTAMVRILNPSADPYGPDLVQQVDTFTNFPPDPNNPGFCITNVFSVTNIVTAYAPTNAIFNFEKVNFRVPADVNDPITSPWTKVTLWVERFGTNNAAETFNYRVNNQLSGDADASEEQNILFPLQPGSDYAVPSPPNWPPIRGTNTDFVLAQGTLSFPGSGTGFKYQPITFTVPTSTLTKFNKDFKIQLYHEVSYNNQTVPALVGMINEATVTILFNDLNPPAGSVDEFYNADWNGTLAVYAANVPVTVPPNDPLPGVGLYGQVYAMTLLPNGEALIGGDFQGYNGYSMNGVSQSSIALVNTTGQLDTSFNAGSGANGAVNAVAPSGSQFYIAGSFSSYNSLLAGGIARVNANGSLDSTFMQNLAGANDTVRALVVLPNGEILIGGDFTQVNGTPCNFLALLTTSGTVDTSFNPTTITGPVYALALTANNQVVVGGSFGVTGQMYQNIARLNLDGSLDTTFNIGTGADGVVHTLAVQLEGQILAGGEFTHFNGAALNRIARLNADGSLDTANFLNGTGADSTVYCINPMILPNSTNYFTNTFVGFTNSVPFTNTIIFTNVSYATAGIYMGGAFDSVNGTHRLGFARLYPNGTVDTTFMDTAYNQFAGLKRIYSTDTPAVLATAIQSDGNVLIGGVFNQVGGGQANTNVCNSLENALGFPAIGLPLSFGDTNLWVEPKTRDGVRNRTGLARLVGGATPGPGNIGLNQTLYSANKSQSTFTVSLVRTNGNLGPVAANFAVQPGSAQSGSDYNYNGAPPIYWVANQFTVHPSRERSDGLSGLSGFLVDPYGLSLTLSDLVINQQSEVTISIINNKLSSGNLNAQFQVANPGGDDTFYLGSEEIPLGAALGVSSAPLTINDDTSYPGQFGFASPTFIATNLNPFISVVRSNGLFGPVQMNYSATNGTAIAGTDYVGLTNKSLNFLQFQSTNGFNVTIKNDGFITNVEKTVNLRLYNLTLTPGATFGFSNAVLRIINPNYQGFVTLGATNYTGTISSGVLNFVVNRTVGSLGTISVQYATTNGSAISGTDYIGATNTLTWNNGDVSPRVVSIPLINPGVVGTNKQFGVTLFNPTLNGGSAPSLFALEITNAALVISNNNNPGTLQFSSPSYTVNENGGYATISVVRSGGTVGTLSATFATSNGTATNTINYIGTNGTVTLASGQSSTSFNIPILNDGVADPAPANFFFNVTLNSTGSPTNTLVHIVDATTYNYPPGSPDPFFNTNGMNGDVLTVALQSNGEILAGGNFNLVGTTPESRIARLNTDGSLDTTFLNGLAGANKPVNSIAVQTDGRILVGGAFGTLDGTTRNFIGRLMTDGSLDSSFNPGSGADNAVYALAETFIGGVRRVYVGGAFGSVNGTTSPGVVRLKADQSDNNNDGTVDSAFNVGSGVDGQVYAIAAYPTNSPYAGKVLVGGSFEHFNGAPAPNLVRLNIDGSLDTNFDANLGTGPGGTVRALAIQLNGQVLVGGGFTNVNGTAANRICRLNVDGTLDANFLAADGVGADNVVYGIQVQPDTRIVVVGSFGHFNGLARNSITRLLPTGAPDPTINFGSGANGDIFSVVIQPADGNLVIGGAFTQFDGQPHAGIDRIFGGSVTGSGAFTFASENFVVNETGIFAPIVINRTGGSSGPNPDGSGNVSVQFATISGGTAVPGTNYTPISTSVVFPAGEVQETVLVPVFDDHVITPDLTVNLQLFNPTPPATNGVQPTATLTIANVDDAIAFTNAFFIQTKGASTLGVIDVLRLGGTSTTCSVDFSTTTNGSTAIPGLDYYPTNATLTFLPGQSDIPVQVQVINNGLVEGNKTVNLVLTNVVNTILTSPSNAVLTILDSVAANGQLFFTSTNFTVIANQDYAYLTVFRTNGTLGTVSARYDFTAETALPGVNYVDTSGGTISFGPGTNTATVPVELVHSGIIQGPVSLSVALSNPTGGATLTGPSTTTLTIFNTNSVFAFQQATNLASEATNIATIVVERFNNTNAVGSVNYTTVDGTAVAGQNYQKTFGTLNFALGQQYASISVPLINNSNITDLQFSIDLSNPVNGYVVAPSNTVVLIEGSAAGISFTTNTTSVYKNATNVLVTVVCSNPSVEPPVILNGGTPPLQVNYMTVDGSARAGLDYQPTSGTLVFTNGVATNSFYVTIFNNTLVSSNLTFSVILTNVTTPGYISPYGTESVTIEESNAGLSFSQANYNAFKNAPFATITVNRTGYTNSVVSVDYLATNGTAIAGQNFFPTNGTLIFTNGQMSQSFNVALIGNNQVQPNLYALVELSNPTNGFVVNPGAATLTILETGSSYVQPAGSQLLTNSSLADLNADVIGSNETVQVLFAFRDAAGLNVTNLIAYLQVTNGVTAPSPASQSYGSLAVYGHSVSRAFSFTAQGTNGFPISPTFMLYDNGKFIGPATFTYTLGTWTTTFANTNAIVINDGAAASPYPSIIEATGLGSSLIKATVTLTNLSDQSLGDVDALVVSPTTNTLIMAHAGGNGTIVNHVTLTFDDGATNSLPQNGVPLTGTNKPTQFYPVKNFP